MECKICNIISGKEKSKKIYEDALAYAMLSSEASAAGHIIIAPKKHVESIEELSDEESTHILMIANNCATAVFDSIGAHGTNILINNGKGHLAINVLPRMPDDGINMKWEPQKLTSEEMEDSAKRIKDRADIILHMKKEGKEPKPEEKKEEIEHIEDDADNYLIKHLRRIP